MNRLKILKRKFSIPPNPFTLLTSYAKRGTTETRYPPRQVIVFRTAICVVQIETGDIRC